MGEQSTYIAGVVVRLRKKFHDPGKALLDLAPNGHVIALGVAFLPLGVG